MIDIKIKKAFLERITEMQTELLLFRKELRTTNLDEWNAKAQMVFTHSHLEAVRQNLERSMKNGKQS